MNITKDKIYILGGATGTEVLRRGFPTELPLWSAKVLFKKPELLKEIHKDYIQAGADIITTNTFRTQRRTLAKVGLAHETERINQLAVDIACQARDEANAGRPVYIAGCMTALEDCYRPDLIPPDVELKREHQEQADILAKTRIDFFLIETMGSVREAFFAAQAAHETGKDFAVSFVIDKNGNLISGETLAEAVAKINPLQPLAFFVNCIQPDVATLGIKKLKAATTLPIGAYANGDGTPSDNNGWEFHGEDRRDTYLHYCQDWITLGAAVIGGCCGTSPEYTALYSKLRK